jgi:hypothetical protein
MGGSSRESSGQCNYRATRRQHPPVLLGDHTRLRHVVATVATIYTASIVFLELLGVLVMPEGGAIALIELFGVHIALISMALVTPCAFFCPDVRLAAAFAVLLMTTGVPSAPSGGLFRSQRSPG